MQCVISAIDHMSSQKAKYFKNVWFTTRWNTHLAPIEQLKIELDDYLKLDLPTKDIRIVLENHTLKLAQMLDTLEKAQFFLKNEIASQQSFVSRMCNRALDCIGENGQKIKEYAHAFAKPSPSFDSTAKAHPLIHLGRLITNYSKYDNSLIDALEKERSLAYALRHLDQTSTLFRGIERQVYINIPEGRLAEHLAMLTEHISLFIRTRLEQSDQTENIRRDLETAMSCPRNLLKVAWECAARSDTIAHLACLANKVHMPFSQMQELTQRVNDALHFFEQSLGNAEVEETLLQKVLDTALGWTELILEWARNTQTPSYRAALSQRLGRIRYTLEQGDPASALIELKKELISAFPSSREKTTSSLKTVQELRACQRKTLDLLEETEDADWENALNKEQAILVDQITYFTAFAAVCGFTHTDNQCFSKAYTQIMYAVARAPSEKQKEVFLSEVKKQIDQQEASTIRKHLIKSTVSILFWMTQFFIRYFFGFLIENCVEIALRQEKSPLDKAQFIPIEGITRCIIAHTKVLKKWTDDDLPLTKKELFATYLKDPKLNLGYEHDALVEQITKYVIAQFLKMKQDTSQSQAYARFRSCNIICIPVHVVLMGCKNIATSLFWLVIEKCILRSRLPHQAIDTIKSSMYQQSVHTNMIDKVLIDHLRKMDQSLDGEKSGEEEAEDEELEGSNYAKKILREAVVHTFELLNYNQCETAQELKQAMAASPQIVEPKKKLEEALIDTIVEKLAVYYQSIFRKKNMRALILEMLQTANTELFPQTPIQRYYSKGEKEIIERTLGRTLSDRDLQAQFLKESASGLDIESAMKVKEKTREQELEALTQKIIEKGVRQVIENLKNDSKTTCQQLVQVIDFFDDHLFKKHMAIRNIDDQHRGTFIRQIEEGFRDFNFARSETDKREVLTTINRHALRFLKKYEEMQRSLDQVAKGKERASAHARRVNAILHQKVIPHVASFYQSMQKLGQSPDNIMYLQQAKATLIEIEHNVYASQAELENIREAAMQLDQQTSAEKVKNIAASTALGHLETIEWYPKSVIEKLTQSALNLIRNPDTFESAIRHISMLSLTHNPGQTTAP